MKLLVRATLGFLLLCFSAQLWGHEGHDGYVTSEDRLSQEDKGASLIVTLNGFTKESVSMDIMQYPTQSVMIPYNAASGRPVEFYLDMDDITAVYINGQLVCVEPDDELELTMNYGENGRFSNLEITGGNNEKSVALNELIQAINSLRRENRFKKQGLAAVVTQVSAEEQQQLCVSQVAAEKERLEAAKGSLSEAGYNYLLAESEATIYSVGIEYPYVLSGTRNIPLDSCFTEGYTSLLEGYGVKSDDASLRNRNYTSFLVLYCQYMDNLPLVKSGKISEIKPFNLESLFYRLVDFYENEKVRDVVLFSYLFQNVVSGNPDFETIDKLVNEYITSHNLNEEYKQELNRVMQ
jgi:hypothetical protein